MTPAHDLTIALRSLDAAGHRVSRAEAQARAQAELVRVLAIDAAPESFTRPRPAGSGRRRVALAVGGMAAAAATAVALPAITGGDRAFATWTRVPRGMTEQQRTEAAADCRAMQQRGAGAQFAARLDSAVPAIAERRGVWSAVVLAGTGGFSALCVTDDSAYLFSTSMIGSVGTAARPVPPGPRGVIATDLGTGTMHGKDLSLAAGRAGSAVVDVIYHSPTSGDVSATVSNGHFALWLPGDDLRNAAARGVTVEVRYRNGGTGIVRLAL